MPELRRLDVLLYPGKADFKLEVNEESKPIAEKFGSAPLAKAYNDALGWFDEAATEVQASVNAFKAWEAATKKLEKEKNNPIKAREVRGEIRTALADLITNATKAGAKVGTEAMVNYLAFIVKHAKELMAEVIGDMDSVPFTYDVKPYTKASWETAYKNAVAAGAVPESKLAEGVSKAIGKYETDSGKFFAKTILNPKDKRKLVEDIVKDLDEVMKAIVNLRAVEGYSSHKNMAECLGELWNRAEAFKDLQALKRVLDGEGAEFPAFKFSFDENHWANTVKPKAVEEGVLGENDGTGLSSTMRDAIYRFSEFMRVTKQDDVEELNPGTRIKYKREAREALAKLIKTAEDQKGKSANKNYQKYMEDCAAHGKKKLQDLDDIKDIGEFQPPPFFGYDNASWQKVKAHAVGAGILPDEKTNMGKFLDDSDAKFKTWEKLKGDTTTLPKDLKAAADKARNALGLTSKKATELQKIAKDPKMVNYLQLGINEVRERFEKIKL